MIDFHRKRLIATALVAVALLFATTASAQTQGTLGFYRSPAIHGETIVFAAEGDLWTVPITGGLARRLTSHAAEESSPAISPDGVTLAFTARYEGPAALYTMPITGGAPTRRTYDGDVADELGEGEGGRDGRHGRKDLAAGSRLGDALSRDLCEARLGEDHEARRADRSAHLLPDLWRRLELIGARFRTTSACKAKARQPCWLRLMASQWEL